MSAESEKAALKAYCASQGMSLFGVADIVELRKDFHPSIQTLAQSFPRAISIGCRLPDAVIDEIVDRPTLIYAAAYKASNWVLDQTALRLTNLVQEKGYSAVPVAASQYADRKAQLGHLSHRVVGHAAGLGWIGRSSLLVNPRYGARVRYATVLTDMPLDPDGPAEGSCGECRDCIDMCPAEAISMDGYDKWKCFDLLNKFSGIAGVGKHICGVCVKACPVNRGGGG